MKKSLFKILTIIALMLTSRFYCVSQNMDYYDLACSKIATMLAEGNHSFKEAVFTVENAYFDNNLDVERYYAKIEKYVDFCKEIKQSGNIMYDGQDQDKALTQYSVFAFMTEKIPAFDGEKMDTVYPFSYNYEDFAGQNDWSSMFVSALMQTKKGNCHSMSYLYKIIMDELGEKSFLSLCPNHLYIKAQNEKMGWYNIELTGRNFPTDGYLISSLYIHLDAIRNAVYMKTLTLQESVALCLIDLAQGYIAKFGVGNGEFVLKCCETNLQYFPDCIISLLLQSQTLSEIYQKSEIKSDAHFAELTELATRIHQLGYRKMPDGMYQNWLSGMKSGERDNLQGMEMSSTTVAQAKEHSPFVKYGYDKPMVFTASYGMFEEFHDFLDTVEIGNVLFDCVNHAIVGFLSAEETEVRADILPLSVDPHADRYWWVTPYAYCNNNPIKIVDPDGRDLIISGTAAGESFSQLSNTTSKDFNLIHKSDGRVSYEGKAKTKADRHLKRVIDNKNVTVNIVAEKAKSIDGKNAFTARDGKDYFYGDGTGGGAYGGNEVDASGHVNSYQYVAPEVLDKMDNLVDGSSSGGYMLHETAEGFFGGKMASRSGKSSPMDGSPGNTYNAAHIKANNVSGGNFNHKTVQETIHNSTGQPVMNPLTGQPMVKTVRSYWSRN